MFCSNGDENVWIASVAYLVLFDVSFRVKSCAGHEGWFQGLKKTYMYLGWNGEKACGLTFPLTISFIFPVNLILVIS
jgi:hypothetical protein